jgi:hypothetical protein
MVISIAVGNFENHFYFEHYGNLDVSFGLQ